MANKISGQIKQIGGSIESLAGAGVGTRVMESAEKVATSNPEDVALWVKAGMNRLDTLVDETTRLQIMLARGYNCIVVNKRPMETARARRQKHPDEEAFLAAEVHKPPKGGASRGKGIGSSSSTPPTLTAPGWAVTAA